MRATGRRAGGRAWGRPPWPLHVRAVRLVARTRLGYKLKRLVRRRPALLRERGDAGRQVAGPHRRSSRRPVRNVLLVSHGDFTTNSGLHVQAIATELAGRGFSTIVAVPGRRVGRRESTAADVRLISHAAATLALAFPDGAGADLVHAFTPRAAVRRAALAAFRVAQCPYVVHLEDDDARIEGGTHASARDAFVTRSAGVTVVVERLLELKPDGLPGAVVWPGFEESILSPTQTRAEVRLRLGIRDDELVVVYNGNVQETNLESVRELYLAVGRLRAGGMDVVLVRTGWNFVPDSMLPRLFDGIQDLGWVAREHVSSLLHAADVLVQPGAPGGFDDYRFPSKLPEFLASGRPVVLPRANIGLHLRDGVEALLLDRGDAGEICQQIATLASDGELRAAVGAAGRAFALRRLRWATSVDRIGTLYRTIHERHDGPGL